MTVIDRIIHSCPNVNSDSHSDVDSLHLDNQGTSDTEQHIHWSRIVFQRWKKCGYTEKYFSRRKQRRYNNGIELQILAEEYEEEEECPQLMEDYKTPFGRILGDNGKLKLWNDFINLPEEEQKRVLDGSSDVCRQKIHKIPKVSSRIKCIIKQKLSLKTIEKAESEVVNFFLSSPMGVFTFEPTSSIERVLCHAIAHYHELKSINLFSAIRRVQVSCNNASWKPVEESFCNFAKSLSQ
ncbi:hypothetical protein FQA39_LY00261 [Lamprigera yunnana]|nr:hypothetical protein FQA39_LY00261 [Lamprigera yunnana]